LQREAPEGVRGSSVETAIKNTAESVEVVVRARNEIVGWCAQLDLRHSGRLRASIQDRQSHDQTEQDEDDENEPAASRQTTMFGG
jgi:hypothetical protein